MMNCTCTFSQICDNCLTFSTVDSDSNGDFYLINDFSDDELLPSFYEIG